MQQALEALAASRLMDNNHFRCREVAAALRKRLAQPEQEPFCYHDGRNIVGKEYADHSDVFPLYTAPNPEQQKPVRFNCTVIDDAHLNGVPLSQWGKQHEMQPCAGRNCGSTNPNQHSAECFEDYEKATGQGAALVAADERNKLVAWMIKHSYATGHGDTIEDLLRELEWQIVEREREACAVIAETPISGEQDDITMEAKDRAAAIRARGNT